MTVYLLFAHPEPRSFNGQLRDVAIETLTAAGHTVETLDLFGESFSTLAHRADFDFHDPDEFFDLQTAQRTATAQRAYQADIQTEHDKLRRADLLILQFPMWWQSMPAPLKGYIDRVFSAGFAYMGANELAGKRVLVSMTTGAPAQFWTADQRGDLVTQTYRHLYYGTLAFCGMRVLEPFVAYGVKRLTPDQQQAVLSTYADRLRHIADWPVIL